MTQCEKLINGICKLSLNWRIDLTRTSLKERYHNIQPSSPHIQNSSRATAVLRREVSLGRVAIMQYAPGWEGILEPLLASKTCYKRIVALLWKRHVCWSSGSNEVMLGVANCGFGLVPIMCSEPDFLARFTSIRYGLFW
jgi:hypothetical protein